MKFAIRAFLTIFFISVVAFAAKITSNILIVGDQNAATDKQIQMGDGILKWVGTTGRLEFSNDAGGLYKAVGSGAGGGAGGVNLLAESGNADFEAGNPPDGWTASAGTYISETTAPGFDGQSASWDSSGISQTFDSIAVDPPKALESNSCAGQIYYKWDGGTPGDLQFQVVDGSANILAQTGTSTDGTPFPAGSTWQKMTLVFTCPTGTTTVFLRLKSLVADPALILLDNAHLGSDPTTSEIAQAELVAHAYYADTTSCNWNRTNAALGEFGTTAACPSITVVSSTYPVDTTDNDLPDIDFDMLPPGSYKITATFSGEITLVASSGGSYGISDGSSFRGVISSRNGSETTPGIRQYTVIANYVYTTSGARNFRIVGAADSGQTIRLYNEGSASQTRQLTWTIERYPLGTDKAITLDAADWYVDANIGGANISLGSSNQTSYISLSNGSLDLVLNSGSQSAQITCSSTNPPTGLTCAAGSENPGIAVTIPRVGTYEVCFDIAHYSSTDAAGFVNAAFQVVRTSCTDDTSIEAEGGVRLQSSVEDSTGVALNGSNPQHVCGYFNETTVGQKCYRLFFEQQVAATVSTNVILADRNATIGQRDIHVTVRPWTTASNTYLAETNNYAAHYITSGASANLSFADNTFETVDYNSKVFDTCNPDCVTVGASWVYTCPKNGLYMVAGGVYWGSTTNMINTGIAIRLGGSSKARSDFAISYSVVASSLVTCNAGQTIDIQAYQDDSTSAARSIATDQRNYISIWRIGPQ